MNAFIIYQFRVFVHGKLFAVAFKIFVIVMNSRKCDVSFQKSVCYYAENCPMRISLQTNLCFIMHDTFEIMR